ncbi:hypothetical protein O181_008004 [Austropuccinia psidii MF-1]|uniref:Peptidase M48 domain-containing protein n=1 Tax=Austropuccinia psidii MF-1 TaxID=1389203 RepID=A0A9Q3BN28_9BASI|nr:hypothetical protein [Austropuccinia psidii MF-1]
MFKSTTNTFSSILRPCLPGQAFPFTPWNLNNHIPNRPLIGLRIIHSRRPIRRRFVKKKTSVHPPPVPSRQPETNIFPKDLFGVPPWIWLVGTFGGTYYISHLEKIELTGRWRFMDTSIEAELAAGEEMYLQILSEYRSKLLPQNHPTSRLVAQVAYHIIQASGLSKTKQSSGQFGWSHSELTEGSPSVTDWKVHVIDEPRIQNAFVIPGGKIFVFTGILPICQTEGGLATVLGHEVAHQVLRHPAERMSSMKVIFLLTTLLTVIGLDPGIGRALVTLLMGLPNSRRNELEADQIGLKIMASACYDPSEAIRMWQRMSQFSSSKQITPRATEFLQTHPTHDRRIEKINSWLPDAQKHLQERCGLTKQLHRQFKSWRP